LDSFILRGALNEVEENFSVLAGPYAAIKTGGGDADTVMQLVTLTRQLASWIVLDVPCTYDDIYFHSLTSADQIVLVLEQTVAAIRGAQLVCEGIGQRQPIVVINRYSSAIQGLTLERIQGFLPTCRVATMDYDAAVVDSMNSGRLLRKHSPRSPILADLENLVSQIAPPESADGASVKQDGILDRLARAFSLS
jgi:pilus assembly protein CpaE